MGWLSCFHMTARATMTQKGIKNPIMVHSVAKPAEMEKLFNDKIVNPQNTVKITITEKILLLHNPGLIKKAIPPAINDKILGYQVAVLTHCNHTPTKAVFSPKASLIH